MVDIINRQSRNAYVTYIKNCAVGGEDLIHGGPEEDAVDVEDPGLVHRLIEVDDADNHSEDLKGNFDNFRRYKSFKML